MLPWLPELPSFCPGERKLSGGPCREQMPRMFSTAGRGYHFWNRFLLFERAFSVVCFLLFMHFCRSNPFCSIRRFCARIGCRMECILRAELFQYMIADFLLKDARYVNYTCRHVCLFVSEIVFCRKTRFPAEMFENTSKCSSSF